MTRFVAALALSLLATIPPWHEEKIKNYLPHMTWPEVHDLLTRTDIVIIPVASLEQHAHHRPIGTDFLKGPERAKLIAQKTDVLVAPILLPGNSPYHMEFARTITLPAQTIQQVYFQAAQSLITTASTASPSSTATPATSTSPALHRRPHQPGDPGHRRDAGRGRRAARRRRATARRARRRPRSTGTWRRQRNVDLALHVPQPREHHRRPHRDAHPQTAHAEDAARGRRFPTATRVFLRRRVESQGRPASNDTPKMTDTGRVEPAGADGRLGHRGCAEDAGASSPAATAFIERCNSCAARTKIAVMKRVGLVAAIAVVASSCPWAQPVDLGLVGPVTHAAAAAQLFAGAVRRPAGTRRGFRQFLYVLLGRGSQGSSGC